MRRSDRLFQLVQFLRVRRFATGQQIADELGVSKRTIYRDIGDLQGAGVPIDGEAGVGYRIDRGFELPPLTFNAEEIESLVLGARIVASWSDPELADAVRSAMTKIEAALPEPLHRVLLETALFAPGRPRTGAMTSELGVLRRAISEHRRVEFSYRRADGAASLRTVRPLALYFWGTKWTLASWCEFRHDYRSFRPDRMTNVVEREETFDGGDGIHLQAYLEKTESRTRERGDGD
jgi:predicted DNA-binding transcriptional regulator YafY